ncbi:MAG: hypothetical protein AAF636_19285 [Pseudomonadota bacterium]
MTVDSFARGQWTTQYNEFLKERSQAAPKDLEHTDRKPPVLGLQDGPKPPGFVREDADRAAREQAARERAFAQVEKSFSDKETLSQGISADWSRSADVAQER